MPDQPVAVVTGATGGIGGAVVQRLRTEGYIVVGLSRAAGSGADLHLPCDVRTDADVHEAAGAVRVRHGRCDALVCCHGHWPVTTPTLALDPRTFLEVLQTDVGGTLHVCQHFGAMMLTQHQGAIVLLSSLHAWQTYPARTAYAASKAAIGGLMRSLALEWGPLGVRVNALLPWQVDGPRSQALIEAAQAQGEDLREAYLRRTPLRRLVAPAEVASAVVFLLHNTVMNGCELPLDGGVSCSMWYHPFQRGSDEP